MSDQNYSSEYNKALVRYAADKDTVQDLLKQIASDPEHQKPGSNLRMVAADALDENGEHVKAEQLRSNVPITGYAHDYGQNLYVTHPSGTSYSLGTPQAVQEALENARRYGTRIHVSYGHQQDGKDWLEEHETTGVVGRSGGRIQVPLLIPTTRSYGGGALLTHSIVRIRSGNNIIYQHPNYDHGEITLHHVTDSKYPDVPYEIRQNGQPHARFRTLLAANRWIKKMGVKVTEGGK